MVLTKISLAFEALLDRVFVTTYKTTQESISACTSEQQQGICESLKTGKPQYFYEFNKTSKKDSRDSSEDSD